MEIDPKAKATGVRIGEIRKRHWTSAAALAKEMTESGDKVTDQTIINWEKGKHTLKAIKLLVKYFEKKGEKGVEKYLLFNELEPDKPTGGRPSKLIDARAVRALVDAINQNMDAINRNLMALAHMCGPAIPNGPVKKAGYSARQKRKLAEERR